MAKNYLFTENKILFEIREKDQSAGISAVLKTTLKINCKAT